MRIFVAGATGVVGRLLVPELIAAGHQVTALIRRPEAAQVVRSMGADVASADIYDAEALTAAVVAAAPEVVMHQLTDLGNQDFAANLEIRRVGTRNLVDAALAAGARKVIAQSIAWAYEAGDGPAGEETSLDLESADGRLKTVEAVAALEEIVAEAPEWVVLRYGLFYGPGTWYAKGAWMDEALRAGRLVPNADVTSFLHVADAATAAVEALGWPTGPVNVVDDEPAPTSLWVPAFAHSIGAPAPAPAPVEPERTPWARGADNTYARKSLNWTPRHPSWHNGFVA